MTSERNAGFPFMSRLIECHGFDVYVSASRSSLNLPCSKIDGKCCMETCRLVPVPKEPEKPKAYDIFGQEI